MLKFNKNLVIIISALIFLMITPANVYADLGNTVLKYGMTNDDVYKLQEHLSTLGFFDNNEFTNYYGDKTRQAVLEFQKSVGIKADGIFGEETAFYLKKHLAAKQRQLELLEKTSTPLTPNDSGERVKEVQDMLKNLGFYEGEINGLYDELTKMAIENFQKNYGLEANGIAEQNTLMTLYTEHDTFLADRAALNRREAGTQLVNYAKQFLGVKYVWAGNSPKGFDCSGFTQYVFKNFGINLEHSASSQFKMGEKINKSNLELGDLVFFTTYKSGPSHVGIYIGSNKFIHASSGSKKVIITDLNSSYYSSRYIGARRYNIKKK